MKKVFGIVAALIVLALQQVTAAYAFDEMLIFAGSTADEAAAEKTTSIFELTGPGHNEAYGSHKTTGVVPRHLSIQNSRHWRGGAAPGPYTSERFDFELFSIAGDVREKRLSGAAQLGAALVTSLAIHELGHVVVADMVGGTGVSVDFLYAEDGSLSFGATSVASIPDESKALFSIGGEVFTSLTFEYALESYRKNPSLFNRSLMFLSGIDFLKYTLYSFYLTEPRAHYDPVQVSNETGFSREALLGVALAKTVMNAYRIYSGSDRVIPYFTATDREATFNVRVRF